jgi:hypothetical protein
MEGAIMDVVATHPFDSTEFLLDATVRHPMNARHKDTDMIPGIAASSGELDKFARYPPARGRHVTPCSIETWGRTGPSFEAFLSTLDAHAQRRDVAQGLPRGLYLPRWRVMLSSALNRTLARAIFESLHPSLPLPSLPFHAQVFTLDPATVTTHLASGSAALRVSLPSFQSGLPRMFVPPSVEVTSSPPHLIFPSLPPRLPCRCLVFPCRCVVFPRSLQEAGCL